MADLFIELTSGYLTNIVFGTINLFLCVVFNQYSKSSSTKHFLLGLDDKYLKLYHNNSTIQQSKIIIQSKIISLDISKF